MSDYQEIVKKVAIDATLRKAVKESINEIEEAESDVKAAGKEFFQKVYKSMCLLNGSGVLDASPFVLIVPIQAEDIDSGDHCDGEAGEIEIKLTSSYPDQGIDPEWTIGFKAKLY